MTNEIMICICCKHPTMTLSLVFTACIWTIRLHLFLTAIFFAIRLSQLLKIMLALTFAANNCPVSMDSSFTAQDWADIVYVTSEQY